MKLQPAEDLFIGTGIAAGNAVHEIKNIAGSITLLDCEDEIARRLEKYSHER